MYENYNNIARELDELLKSSSVVIEDKTYDDSEILKAIETSNENLDKEFEEIYKIKIESLKATWGKDFLY